MQREIKIDKENKNKCGTSPKLTFSGSKTSPQNRLYKPTDLESEHSTQLILTSLKNEASSQAIGSSPSHFPCPFSPSPKKDYSPTPFVSFMKTTQLEKVDSEYKAETDPSGTLRTDIGHDSSRLPVSLEKLIISEQESDTFWSDQAKQLSIALATTRARLEKAEGSVKHIALYEQKCKDLMEEINALRSEILRCHQAERNLDTIRNDAELRAERWEAKFRSLQERLTVSDSQTSPEMKRFRDALANLSATNAELQRRNKDLTLNAIKSFESIQQENQRLSTENEKLMMHLRQKEETQNCLQKKFSQLQTELAKITTENKNLIDSLLESEKNISDLQNQLLNINELQIELKNIKAQLFHSEKTKELQILKLKDLIEISIADTQLGELATLRAKIAELQCGSQKSPSDKDVNRLNDQQARTALAEIKVLSSKLDEKCKENEELLIQIQNIDDEKNENQVLKSELTYLRGLNTQLLDKCEELRDKLSKAEHQALTSQLFENQVRHFEKELITIRKELEHKRNSENRFSSKKKENDIPKYK